MPAVMNLLIMGNDHRAGVVDGPGSTDVLMLLHVDQEQDFVSILSIPRDLWVNIPGSGEDRVNSAFYRGGPALTIATIKQALGVDATKFIGVGFETFPGIIDSLGGVYIDVDRRYTDAPTWAMDLSPGYQLLDGENTLRFSRYRYDENRDFGRMARQQRVLAAIREQMSGWDLPFKLPGTVGRLLTSATTNLSADELVTLGYWLFRLDDTRIKQIIIKGEYRKIDAKWVVVAKQETLVDAVTEFMAPPGAGGPAATAGNDQLSVAVGLDPVRPTGGIRETVRLATAGDAAFLLAAAPLPNAAMWTSAQKSVPFALEAPRHIPEGFSYFSTMPEGGGTYGIKVGDGTKPAVRMVYRYKDTDFYLGVTATTWTDAPLAREGTSIERNGVIYTIVGSSESADHIWWKKDGVLYFISNTLMYTVGQWELLEMAESMTPVEGSAGTAG
jgi:LCP family protein required for cell wall assembly